MGGVCRFIYAWVFIVWFTSTDGKATLYLPSLANCWDQAQLTCISSSCRSSYKFTRNGVNIYTNGGPQAGIDPTRYSTYVSSSSRVLLTITNVALSDYGSYACACYRDTISTAQTLQYLCKASTSSAVVTSSKKLQITVDRLYPYPSLVTVRLNNLASQLIGSYSCEYSSTLASHYRCTWVSTASLPDGYHGYTITVTTGTQVASVTGSFRIVTPTSPIISNLMTISNNRQVLRGVQDSSMTIQCESRGGIPAPTLAWHRGSTSTSPLAQSYTSVPQSDGTYKVTLTYSFPPRRTDDSMIFLCRVFYPGATNGASPDPSPAAALLYLDLKADIPTVSQTGEAISGGIVTLRCISTNGRPAPSITWSYQGQTFSPSSTSHLDPTSETYTVVSVLQRPVSAVNNGQTATCRVSHTTLSPITQNILVEVKFGPSAGSTTISCNQAMPVMAANQIRLNCTSGSSNPLSNITWYNGSNVIPITGGYTTWSGNNNGVITSNIMTIPPTRYMDGDKITCRTDNMYGSDSNHVYLDVLYSPLIQALLNVSVIEGEPNITLACSASSKPPGTFTWYKGGMVLTTGTGTLTDNSFSYVIPRVDRTNAGSYRCQARNNVGLSDMKEMHLTVKHPPTVTVSTTTSPSYTITCAAEGNPDSYTYQDWVQVWPGYGPVATIPFNGTTLTLTDVTYERSGVYLCGASNGVDVYGTNISFKQGNSTILIKSPPVLTDRLSGASRVRVAGRLGQNATSEIRYWSNVDGSVVGCYKLVGGSRSSSSSCFVTETDTEVTLPVYNHMVKEKGTLATIKIPIISEEDLTDYAVVITNNVQGASVLGISIVLQDIQTGELSQVSFAAVAGITVSGIVILTVIGLGIFLRWRYECSWKMELKSAKSENAVPMGECGNVYESAGPTMEPDYVYLKLDEPENIYVNLQV